MDFHLEATAARLSEVDCRSVFLNGPSPSLALLLSPSEIHEINKQINAMSLLSAKWPVACPFPLSTPLTDLLGFKTHSHRRSCPLTSLHQRPCVFPLLVESPGHIVTTRCGNPALGLPGDILEMTLSVKPAWEAAPLLFFMLGIKGHSQGAATGLWGHRKPWGWSSRGR